MPARPPAPPAQYLTALLAAITAAGSLAALAGTAVWQSWLPAALWHLAFAVGALPMILAAMIYFVPVLTRTPEPPRRLAAIPLAALAAGAGIVAWFVEGIEALRLASPWLALAAAGALGAWIARRRRACLGTAHACLRWYVAALACLGCALAAVGLSPWLPGQTQALRALHLHLNTLGFMGLTAIGTLQVLLPTVLGRPDGTSQLRLRQDLKWSLAGVAGIAIGAAWWWPLAAVAAAAYAWPLLRLLVGTARAYGRALFAPGQGAPLLLAAIAGLLGVVVHGVLHGIGQTPPRQALPLFVVGVLLPLVSGAISQLLPVWLRPGPQTAWHPGARRQLAAGARTRALLLVVAGGLAALAHPAGYALGMVGAAWLVAAMLVTALRR